MDPIYVHSSAVIDAALDGRPQASIGDRTRIWHFCHVMAGAKIGKDCVLGQNVFVGEGARIGNGCHIQNNVSIYNGVILEDDVFVGPSAVFTNVLTPRANVDRRSEFLPTKIQRGATIGANATIMCGIVVGRSALVGAGAVVTKDVDDHTLVMGVPAKPCGLVCVCGNVLREEVCQDCGEVFSAIRYGEVL